MHTLFLGDSFTAGEGASSSFTKHLKFSNWNFGFSGTTMGEYSIYPVDGHSLVSQVDRLQRYIESSDIIFLEYGINDATALTCGFCDRIKVMVSFVKAIDRIKQLNKNAKIYFLVLSHDTFIIDKYAQLQCNYLTSDYFHGYDFNIPKTVWAQNYTKIVDIVKQRCDVISMIDDKCFLNLHLSDDKVHPNDYGYKLIAEKLNRYIVSE